MQEVAIIGGVMELGYERNQDGLIFPASSIALTVASRARVSSFLEI